MRESGEERALWPAKLEAEAAPPWAWLAALTLLAAVFRGIGLDQQLWYDEMLTLMDYVRLPMAQILTTYTSQNQHMLYSVLARASVSSFGEAAWTLRLPAAVLGVVCVPVLYFFARLLTTRREALAAAALMAASYHQVWFSQNARGYTGLALATLLSSYFFLRGAREVRLRRWVFYGVTVALGMYVHLTMGVVAAGHAAVYAWLLAGEWRAGRARERRAWLPAAGFALAAVLTLALYAPVMSDMLARTLGEQAARGAPEAVRAEWRNPVWMIAETLRSLAGNTGAAGLAAVLAALALAAAGLVSYLRQDYRSVLLMLLPCAAMAAMMLALSRNLWPRFFFFAGGFALLFLVRGVMRAAQAAARLARRAAHGPAWGTAALAVALAASCVQTRSAWIYPKQDFLGALEWADARAAAGERVVLVGLAELALNRFYGRRWPVAETAEDLEGYLAQGGEVVVLYTIPVHVASRYPAVWNMLQTQFTIEKVFRGTMGGGEVFVCRARRRA